MRIGMSLLSVLISTVASAGEAPLLQGQTVKFLSFNVWTANAAAIARDVRISGADIVCLQEASVQETAAATASLGPGWTAVSPQSRLEYSILSRFPVVQYLGETQTARGGVGALIEIQAGRRLAFFCHHGHAYPYGPYQLGIDGFSSEQVMNTENQTRMPAMNDLLSLARPHMTEGALVFLAGDFNAPSHLDYDPYVAWPVSTAVHNAGFADSYADLHPGNAKKSACQFNQNDPGITWAKLKSEEPFNCFDRIDFIYYKPGNARPIASDTIELESSDHRAVYTTFEIN